MLSHFTVWEQFSIIIQELEQREESFITLLDGNVFVLDMSTGFSTRGVSWRSYLELELDNRMESFFISPFNRTLSSEVGSGTHRNHCE